MNESPRARTEGAAILSALVRLMAHWSSPAVQARIAAGAGVDLDPAAIRAIYVLGRFDRGLRPAELADLLAQLRPTTSKMITRLTAAGLVQRAKEETDGRGAVIALTEAGCESYQRLVDAGLDMVDAATREWEPARAAMFAGYLERFVGAMVDQPDPTTDGVERRVGTSARRR